MWLPQTDKELPASSIVEVTTSVDGSMLDRRGSAPEDTCTQVPLGDTQLESCIESPSWNQRPFRTERLTTAK